MCKFSTVRGGWRILAAIVAAPRNNLKSTMQTFIGIRQIHHFQGAVFQIPTTKGDVFMFEERTNYLNDERAIVEVDAERFLALWRHPFSSHSEIAAGNPETWPNDSKFHMSDKHFAEGILNPVPLADISVRITTTRTPVWRKKFFLWKELERIEVTELPALSFSDGVTRTIWLLSFGAKHFPVKCSIKEAPLLQALAGIPGGRFRSVDELIPKH